MNTRKLIFLAAAFVPVFAMAQTWQPKKATLMSKFAKDVDPAKVLPEYPRPQFTRTKWMNLNGLWQYQPAGSRKESLPAGNLSSQILVPFPVESALSGVMEHHEAIWYKKKFTLPADWKGQHIMIHFGAVDYESEVFVNGKSFGVHSGGYDPFSYDITNAIKGGGAQEITVRVWDPTDDGGFPRGKQTLNPQGIMYTSVTGIWQTVWLEPVPAVHIENIKIVPDVDRSMVHVTVNAPAGGTTVASVAVKDGATLIKTVMGKPNTVLDIPVANAKLWSPDAPFLYDLDIKLVQNGKTLDKAGSYFGMRKIAIAEEGGFKKMFLNNKFLFQIGPLDQGFWPDGGYTAPTDEALKYDLEMIKKFGYNIVRKHIKVEPYRWYYWADKLGLMVWQDMPSPNSYTEHVPPVDTAAFASELKRMVTTHWNSPSIVTWVVFNESQAQHKTKELVNLVRSLDTTRLINQASGGSHFDAGDIMDIHSYPPPAAPTSTWQTLACGEYGGIGFIIPNHIWKSGPTYIMIDNEKDYTKLYDDYATDLTIFKTSKGLSAAVYTEITDVEVELNGLLTYDREVIKGAVEKIRASNEKVINQHISLTDLLPSSQEKPREWKYTLSTPATGWEQAAFNDSAWKKAMAGFGSKNTPGGNIQTEWTTNDIWLRQEFTLGDLSNINRDELVFYAHHDEDCEIFINGVKAAALANYTSSYAMAPMSKEAQQALKANGKNIMAIHCKQTQGGQYIDAGISILKKQ